MSESADNLTSNLAIEKQSFESQDSAGKLLKDARESVGLHIAALAVSLKVSVKKIEALEADQWDTFPDTVFVRALASSVCRHLKIDSVPILQRLPKVVSTSGLSNDKGINAPLISPGFAANNSGFEQLSKPVVLIGLALLVGALVLIFFPSADRLDELVVNPPQGSFPSTPAPELVSVPTTDSDLIKQAPSSEVVEPREIPVPIPPSPAASSPQVSVKSEPALLPALNAGQLIFKSRGASWVEVMDAKGVPQLRRNLEAGETVDVSGALPLSVVVGRADVVDIQVRGKPFDLQAVTKSNVARFEVKL
jgi:cytoskeleton protein RodZ